MAYLVTEVWDIPQPRNRQVPTDGVHRSMHRFMMMIPKWSGCMPRSLTTDKNIVVRIRIPSVMSINVPTAEVDFGLMA